MTASTTEDLNKLRSLLPSWEVTELETDEGEKFISVTDEDTAYCLWKIGEGQFVGACTSHNGEMFQGGYGKVARAIS